MTAIEIAMGGPGQFGSPSGNPPDFTTSQMDLNSGTDFGEIILQIPVGGSLSEIGFRVGSVTAGCTLSVRLETMSATTGRASGTLYHANASGTVVVADTDDNTWKTVSFTSFTVTRGDLVAIKIGVSSGTPSALQLSLLRTANSPEIPMMIEDDGTPAAVTGAPCLAIKISSAWVALPGCLPMSALNSHSFASNTTDARGLRFQVPIEMSLAGFWHWADIDGDVIYELIDDSETVLASLSWDKDYPNAAAGLTETILKFGSSVTLSANTTYRLMCRATTTTAANFLTYSVPGSAYLTASHFCSSQFYLTEATHDGSVYSAPTDTNTEVPWMGLYFDGVEVGSGGGGGLLRHPGMAGGMNG